MRSRLSLAAAVLSVLVMAPMPTARAEPDARVFASRSQFVPGETENHVPVVLVQGNKLQFENADPFAFSAHTLTADGLACPTCGPLFDSGDVAFGTTATLDTSRLAAGTYTFHCNHHSMFGTLLIVGV